MGMYRWRSYVIAGILFCVIVYELMNKLKNERHNILYLVIERTYLNMAGLTLNMIGFRIDICND